MDLMVVGVSHQTAPVEVREALAVAPDRAGKVLAEIAGLPGVHEVAVLSTCNRVEVYAVTDGTTPRLSLLDPLRGDRAWRLPEGLIERSTYVHTRNAAVRHLFRVVAGLDSLIVGECQILGQVKDAYEAARSAGRTGPILNILFQKAISAAKGVHTETGLSQGKASVASVAMDFLGKVFASFDGKTVLMVGAGQTADLVLSRLQRHAGVQVLIANRCLERARKLAAQVGGTPIPLGTIAARLAEADIVVLATAADRPLLGPVEVAAAIQRRAGRPICLLDICVPRNVDPLVSTLPNAYLFDLDDLQEEVARTQVNRHAEAARGERRVAQLIVDLWPQLEERLAHGGRAVARPAAAATAAQGP